MEMIKLSEKQPEYGQECFIALDLPGGIVHETGKWLKKGTEIFQTCPECNDYFVTPADGFYRFVPDGEDGDSVYAVIEIVTDETEYDEAYWTVFCLD